MGIFAEYGFGLTENAWSLFSPAFLTFLAVTLVIYYVLPCRTQWIVLLAASIVFYFFAGTPYTILYLLVSTLVTWKATCIMEDYRLAGKEKKQIRNVYLFALFTNIGILAALKYTNFLLGNVSVVASVLTGRRIVWQVSWIAALGVSFYTLQIVSYLTDCYWQIVTPQRSYARFILFSCFFPQMVSGPISRYQQLSNQLYAEHPFSRNNLMTGFIRIALGFFKKLVIAENFTRLAQYFFDLSQPYSFGIFTLIAIGCYVVELYGDFAGCMDIVLGSARCFGIDIIENFNSPFCSVSIQEFWQRWHITLGSWLKDYIMYPLLRSKAFQKLSKQLKKKFGKQVSQKGTTYLAMLILWFCMGLWHGGGWNFIVEGIWFWLVIVLGQLAESWIRKVIPCREEPSQVMTLFRQTRTVCIYAVGAIFFRGPGVVDAFRIIFRALSPQNLFNSLLELPDFLRTVTVLEISDGILLYTLVNSFCGFLIFSILSHWEKKHGKLQDWLTGHTMILQITSILVVLYVILFLGVYGPGFQPSDFIYGGF